MQAGTTLSTAACVCRTIHLTLDGMRRRQPSQPRAARGRISTQSREHALILLATAAPLAAQLALAIGMALQRQWLFMMMIIPGALGCLASMLLQLPSSAHTAQQHQTNTRIQYDRAAIASHDGDFPTTDCPSLEQLTSLDVLPWRTMVNNWINAGDTLNATFAIGRRAPFTIDLIQQGPHALVAGTTGSGKSILLQSWCLSLACSIGPDRLHFVFLDFKGGAAFRPLEPLPHTVGNVCDLDLAHATRALRALERELRRRERLASEHRVQSTAQLDNPEPRLLVVIDEFHALKDQLPHYMDRLVRIASLGRSLGMHLIACTQNPLGQVNADMKANMSINICLRVRDALQSIELLGDSRAASISPSMPGAAYCNDASSIEAFRCAAPRNADALCHHAALAARFAGIEQPAALFTEPLPDCVADQHLEEMGHTIRFGMLDDGIELSDALLDLDSGNIGIFGASGRGKSTLLHLIARHIRSRSGYLLRLTQLSHGLYRTERTRSIPSLPPDGSVPATPQQLWLVDDADALLDPLSTERMAEELRTAIASPDITVIFTATSMRHVRVPEQCHKRLIFPKGERNEDLMSGIPPRLLEDIGHREASLPGRAVLISSGEGHLVQCAFGR